MKCPKCGYVDGREGDLLEFVDGDNGKFFESPIRLERVEVGWVSVQTAGVYGCPKCGTVFLGD